MDSEEYLAEQWKELWRIKTRIIGLLIAAVTFVVLTILALIINPPTNILPVTLGWPGFSLTMAAVEYLFFRPQKKRVEELEEELNTVKEENEKNGKD